jgi:hypothetical protein
MKNLRLPTLVFAGLALLVQAGPLAGQSTSARAPLDPAQYLGHPVGADFKLAGWETITSYFNNLASASPMVSLETLGSTTQGRPFLALTISSAQNLGRLEEIQLNQAKLADPRSLEEGELEALLETQPAVVLIANNIHSTEIASSQGVMELVYSLISDPELAEALEDVVVLIIPSVNPDGQQMVTEWYARTLGTPYEGSRMPWLYHYYVGHDNNRDWYMLTQVETRLLTELLYDRWFPEVVYDVHQMGGRGARFFVPPFDNPPNPNLDPLVVRMISLYGIQISTDLAAAGKSGVVNSLSFDLWWHGGLRTAPARHNMVGILSESASARIASPTFQTLDELRQPRRSIAFPDPWPGGWWRLRDIIDYQLIAARSVIGLSARQRRQLISNYVELGRRAVEAGRSEPPFAYVVPENQTDPGSAARMLEIIRQGGVEIHQATVPFEADGVEYAAGDWVVLMAQPYRAHAKDLLERQDYPDLRLYPGGPPDAPYDAAGWTLPLQMGVEAVEVKTPFETQLRMLDGEIKPPAGSVDGSGPSFALDYSSNAANLAVNRALSGGGRVAFLSEPAGDRRAGSVAVQGPGIREILDDLSENEGLSAQAFNSSFTGYSVDGVRAGLYQPWTASMDEGWTRWVFDEWDLPYSTLHDAEIRAGNLRARYDVIILPDLSPGSIIEGRTPGTVPPEYTGGLGDTGVAAIRDFVRAGGTLVCLDASSNFAIEQLGLPVKSVKPSFQEQRSGQAFYAPGSILAVTLDTSHPLGYGMPQEAAIYYSNSPIFEVEDGAEGVTVVARYRETGQLLSGYALESDFLSGKAALVEARSGDGRVVLFGFKPQYRGQSQETFKVLFNAIYMSAAGGPERVVF